MIYRAFWLSSVGRANRAKGDGGCLPGPPKALSFESPRRLRLGLSLCSLALLLPLGCQGARPDPSCGTDFPPWVEEAVVVTSPVGEKRESSSARTPRGATRARAIVVSDDKDERESLRKQPRRSGGSGEGPSGCSIIVQVLLRPN